MESFPRIFKMRLFSKRLLMCEENGMWYWRAKRRVWKQVRYLQWKKVGGFSMYLVNFELLKSLKLTFIDYLEIEIWKETLM